MNETVVFRNELGGYSTSYAKDTLARLYYELQKENEHLTAENERLSKQLSDGKCVYLSDSETSEGCVQSPCPNYKTVEDILKENAELKARLDKAVELPCVYNTFSNKRQKCYGSWYVLRKTDHGSFVCENCFTKERAFARLAELKGGEGE